MYMDHSDLGNDFNNVSYHSVNAFRRVPLVDCPISLSSGSDEKLKKCIELGADVGINYKKEDFVERAKAETDGKGLQLQTHFHFRNWLQQGKQLGELSKMISTEYDHERRCGCDIGYHGSIISAEEHQGSRHGWPPLPHRHSRWRSWRN